MILLVYPDCKARNYQKVAGTISAIQPNIYMALLHSYIKSQGIEVEMINCDAENLSNEEVCAIVEEKKPKFVGIVGIGHNLSSSTMTMVGVIDLCSKLNLLDMESKVFVLGGHPTVLPERTLKETGVDYVITGEGYHEIVDLYRNGSSNSIIKTEKVIDVDKLPMIDWDIINPQKYRAHNWHCLSDLNNRTPYGVIWTSMGCPYPCDFCAVNNLFEGQKLYRKRSMKNVVAEIDKLVLNHGVRNIKIIDELFITQHKRMDEFCDLLEKRNYDLNMWCFSRIDTINERILKRLKGVGMNWVAYGFESISQKSLDASQKRNKVEIYDTAISMTREAGINICADVIAGLPDDDDESIQDTYDFCVKNNFEFMNIYPAFAYPGTQLYDKAIKYGYMTEPTNWAQYSPYGYECLPLKTKHLNAEQVLFWRDKFFYDYYAEPKYLNMVEEKFGKEARQHIIDMTRVKLDRKILNG